MSRRVLEIGSGRARRWPSSSAPACTGWQSPSSCRRLGRSVPSPSAVHPPARRRPAYRLRATTTQAICRSVDRVRLLRDGHDHRRQPVVGRRADRRSSICPRSARLAEPPGSADHRRAGVREDRASAATALGMFPARTVDFVPPDAMPGRLARTASRSWSMASLHDLTGDRRRRVMVCVTTPCDPAPGTPEAFGAFWASLSRPDLARGRPAVGGALTSPNSYASCSSASEPVDESGDPRRQAWRSGPASQQPIATLGKPVGPTPTPPMRDGPRHRTPQPSAEPRVGEPADRAGSTRAPTGPKAVASLQRPELDGRSGRGRVCLDALRVVGVPRPDPL